MPILDAKVGGYLQVSVGSSTVEMLYGGKCCNAEEKGWLFGKHCNGAKQGWLPAEAVRPYLQPQGSSCKRTAPSRLANALSPGILEAIKYIGGFTATTLQLAHVTTKPSSCRYSVSYHVGMPCEILQPSLRQARMDRSSKQCNCTGVLRRHHT